MPHVYRVLRWSSFRGKHLWLGVRHLSRCLAVSVTCTIGVVVLVHAWGGRNKYRWIRRPPLFETNMKWRPRVLHAALLWLQDSALLGRWLLISNTRRFQTCWALHPSNPLIYWFETSLISNLRCCARNSRFLHHHEHCYQVEIIQMEMPWMLCTHALYWPPLKIFLFSFK